MACSSARSVVFEEMEALLSFIELENSQYEKERNELKAQFHSRPLEERNIVKDILTMHSEFDIEVSKVKNIVEDLTKIPTEKTSQTTKAEDLASQIVIMQASLVRKHDILQKFLVQKINYQRLSEEAKLQAGQIQAANEDVRYRMVEIGNYSKNEVFNKKIRYLESEIERLSNALEGCADPAVLEDSLFGEWEEAVIGLTEKEAEGKLRRTQEETKKLQESVAELPQKYLSKEAYFKLKDEVSQKHRRVEELKRRLSEVSREGQAAQNRKLEVRNSERVPIGKPAVAPRNSSREVKNNNLLKDIEASLSRVRAIASPMSRKPVD